MTSITAGTRTEEQANAIAAVEKHLNAQSASAKKTSKSLRRMQDNMSAARTVTGQFHQFASQAEWTKATEFFSDYASGGVAATGL